MFAGKQWSHRRTPGRDIQPNLWLKPILLEHFLATMQKKVQLGSFFLCVFEENFWQVGPLLAMILDMENILQNVHNVR